MYDAGLTKQSLTEKEYLYLLGVSQWVFNSNCHFIIEMIDNEHHNNSQTSWFEFLELTAGQIKNHGGLVQKVLGGDIFKLFSDLVDRRNTIIHCFPSGKKEDGYYVPVYRKSKESPCKKITKEFLREFIQDNEELSSLIYKKRGF